LLGQAEIIGGTIPNMIAFGIFFIIILGLIVYSVDGLLFNND